MFTHRIPSRGARATAEARLRQSEARFRALFESSALPLFEQDWSETKRRLDRLAAAGVADIGRYLREQPQVVWELVSSVEVLETNRAALELFRAPDRAAILSRPERLVARESWPVTAELVAALAAGQRRFRGESVVHAFDGTRHSVMFDFVTLPGSEDSLERVLVSLVDITERQHAESELRRQREALAELNRNLEQRVSERSARLRALAAELAQTEQRERVRMAQLLHDHLQQLLVGAKMKLDAVSKQIADPPVHEALRDIGAVLEESIRASRSLAVELSPPILQQRGLAAGLEWLARSFRDKHGLHVEVRADRTAAPDSSDTRFLLFQAVRELLLNVVQHARVRRAQVLMRRGEDDHVVIEVRDEGAGFEPGAASGGSASGFGLFSVEQRLAAIGGTMHVRSARGRGTSVTLAAPRDGLERAGEAHARRNGESRIRVLLADDHKFMRHELVELLQDAGDIEVVGEAADGREALELADRLQPQLVIMDVTMPRLDGIEATRRLKRRWPHMRVIALSMHEEAALGAKMRAAGADAYLTKDRPDVLLGTIRRAAA